MSFCRLSVLLLLQFGSLSHFSSIIFLICILFNMNVVFVTYY